MDRESNVKYWLRNINEQLTLIDRRCHMRVDEAHSLLVQLSEDGQELLLHGEITDISMKDELYILRSSMVLNGQQDTMKRCWLATHQNKLLLIHELSLVDCDEIDFENTMNNFIVLMSTLRTQFSSVSEPINEVTMPYSQQLIKG
ncbi:CesT family type III secretion system chaperone [Vibrio sp. 10N.222.54.F12]|jgi:hypothetical protein|uniref:CesT family type III secretion system chaperone n=2 Tax=Vibrio TaxID=662 RepID=A0ABV4KV18_9VIBR|nr:CesT family type III secretion system chaperone [Vibrio tasmaniensis]OEF44667.1 hypothetical protein A163_11040 [Vibrio tasmaniensis 1F-267]OEF73084.1 hypothetical protein A152_11055 [Vibrio tasmaniensis 1F-187]OEF76682.1 hypothetical protein A162_17195 [Vibrio tasmaniensis 1F-155]PML18762.1 hypothetical protein BCT83_22210 [Vibrio tasmaniensis]PML51645.1 hypothetical protein BCT76_22615 [Vibrio tasmaniensis]